MKPLLLDLDVLGHSLKFHAYPTMLSVAFLTATFLAVRHLNRLDPPVRATTHGGLAAFFGGLIGAKALWVIQLSDEPWQLWRAFYIWTAGFVYYGGLLGAVLAVLAYVRVKKLPVLRTADGCAPYLALGEGITRVGCFLTGCCWGRETTAPWAVQFPRASSVHWFMRNADPPVLDSAEPFTMPLHPTQLYMCLGLCLIVFPILSYVSKKPPFRGSVALMYLFSYGVLRFTVEAFRGDSGHPALGMTMSQLISLGLAVFSLLVFVLMRSTVFTRAGGAESRERVSD